MSELMQTKKDQVDGWEISFSRNVHMYCHALSAKKDQYQISISCEDLPTKEKTIGAWLYNSDAPEEIKIELQRVLRQWCNKLEVKFHLYVSKDELITNYDA